MSILYRLDIAPLTPLPLTRSPFFSYRHTGPLPLGTLVQIPFGSRSLRGIVYASHPLPGRAPLWLKPIEHVIREHWLTTEQRELATFISEVYFSSLGNTLKHFVFSLPKKNPVVTDDSELPKPLKKKLACKKTQTIECVDEATLQDTLRKTIEQGLKTKGQTLILVPDLFLLTCLKARFTDVPSPEVVFISSHTTPKQTETTWRFIKSGNTKVIIGTRQSLFAPFRKLKDVVCCYPEERLSYKQWDMTPYYEATVLLQKLQLLHHSTLTWLTTSPGLGVTHKHVRAHTPKGVLVLIDRRQDGKGARSRIFSKEVEKMLTSHSHSAKGVFIAKERGVTGMLVCLECKTPLRCPNCEHLLSENQAGVLRCLACGYTNENFPRCTQCGHMHFRSFGIGTVRIERELEKLFPDKRILRIDRDTLSTPKAMPREAKTLLAGTFDYLVTTHEIGTLLPLPKQDFIVMVEADYRLGFPSFDGEERLLLEIQRLQAKLSHHGKLLAQTFVPEERVWQQLIQNEEFKLRAELLEERQVFGYPPLTGIIQIGILPEKNKVMTEKARLIHKRYQELITHYEGFKITPLYQSTKKRKGVLPSFLMKYPKEHPLPPTLITALKRDSAHLRIDREPLHLL